MAVHIDPEHAALEARALDALAEAGLAALREERVADVARLVVHAVARAAGADVVVARTLDPERDELVVQAAAAATAELAPELEGGRAPAAEWTGEAATLLDAPRAVRDLADRLGAEDALAVPVVDGGRVVGTVELYREAGPIGAAAAAAARLGVVQLALGAQRLARGRRERAGTDGRALRMAGEALAAVADAEGAAAHVLRIAVEVSGASAGAIALADERGDLVPAGAVGPDDEAEVLRRRLENVDGGESGAIDVTTDGERRLALLHLGDPAIGALALAFEPQHVLEEAERERLALFALRAAHTLHAAVRVRRLSDELEQTRALLTVVGQASVELSLAHTLQTAVDHVASLVGATRLAVYLRDEGRMTVAAERGVAGPHLRVAGALLELALGPFRGRGTVLLDDARSEPRLADVADALAEVGVGAAVALPLLAGDEVVGLLALYPEDRLPRPNEAGLLAALAARLAVAVQNARLHERATRLGAELEGALDAERGAARRLRALYEISRSFAQSLSLEVTLETVARTIVELVDVDAAVLRMPDPRREQLLPLAMHVADERLTEPVRAMLYRPQPLGGAELRRLFRTGEPLVLDAAVAAQIGGSHALLVPFVEKGATGAIVPLATQTEVLASLTLVSFEPSRPISPETIETAIAIGGQAALAIENARLYQQQKDFADTMQRSLLPQVRPPVRGLDVGEVYAPSARVDVGGDLYDYIALESGRLAVVLGDVTGHGIDAAADMAMAKYVFRSLAREHPEPAAFLAAANDVVVGEIGAGKFITMLYLLIDPDTGEVACACAGHPPPRLVDTDGHVGAISARGLALGIDSGIEYEEVRARLDPGGAVVLYTDGVIEARRGSELFGTDRLDALLGRRHALPAEDIAASVVQAARRFTGGELHDDCAVVVVKRTL